MDEQVKFFLMISLRRSISMVIYTSVYKEAACI
jgi:hypothetical protein